MTRAAIIGCGLIGRKRAQALPNGTELVGLFDIESARSTSLSEHLGMPWVKCESIGEILDDSSIDYVVVATAHDQLGPIGRDVLASGKHLLVEKPGARDLRSLIDLEAAASRFGGIVRVGFNHRFHPAFLQSKRLIDSGQYGRPLWVRGRYGHGGRIGYEHEWRAKRSISGGGELLDQGSHLIDLTHFLVGETTLKHSTLKTLFWPMEVEDNAFLALEMPSGGISWLHASWSDWKNTFSFEICLETAKIEIHGLGGSYGEETLMLFEMSEAMGPPAAQSFQWANSDESWRLELEDFERALHGASPGLGASLPETKSVHQIISQAYSQ